MSMTAAQVIAASLRLIGALASGENPNGNEQVDALQTLNNLIDSWSNEQLTIVNKVRETFALIGGQQTYTMGSGGNFDTSRAMMIENALIQLTASSPVLELPMDILTKEQYQGILLKTTTATYPMYIYPDYAYPLTNIAVWPVPIASGNNIVLYSWKPLSNLAAGSTSLSLPQGYQRALIYNLAIDLAPEYGKAVSQEVVAIASESKANIKRMNFKPRFLRVDKELQPKPAVFNWLTGEVL